MEHKILALLHRTLRHHKLPLVGPAFGLYLHQPAWNAHPGFWLLRLLVHNLDTRSAPDRSPVFLNTIQGWPGNMPSHLSHPVD